MLDRQLDHLHFSLRCIREGEEERDAREEALHTHIAWLRIGMDKMLEQMRAQGKANAAKMSTLQEAVDTSAAALVESVNARQRSLASLSLKLQVSLVLY